MSYQQDCEDFALFSSPWEEHCQYEDNAAYDYHHEAYAGETDQFAWCEDFTEEDYAFCEKHGVTDEASYNRACKATLNIRDLI